MQMRDIVQHKVTGKIGVIMPTISLLSREGKWSVVYDHANFATVVQNEADFEVVGSYSAIPDEAGCGAGKGSQCCRFLDADAEGYVCLRFGEFHLDRLFAESVAKRQPNRLYPDCKQPA